MSPKSITVDDIMSFGPCREYTRERVEALRKSVCGRRKKITALDILKADIPDNDKCWLIIRPELMDDADLHAIGLFKAEKIALPIWQKYYPDDNRPAEAIRIKKLWLEGKATDEELAAARAAARAAASEATSEAASDAVSDAVMAASCAVSAASYAVSVVITSAWAAVSAVSAVRSAAWKKIIKKLTQILEAQYAH